VTLIADEHKNALTIPTQAVFKDNRGIFIYVSVAGKAARKNITIGIEQSGRTEIVAGLAAADSIITTGQQFVKDGSPITVEK
jgi:membrane fusion protein (multidrug efflux system)